MKTPPNDADAVMRRLLRDSLLGTSCTAGLLARAGAWSRGPACGDATVQARMRTALKSGARCPAPGSHPSAKADGTCSALRGTSRALCGHFGHARLANSENYWPRRSSPNCLANPLAIIASPS